MASTAILIGNANYRSNNPLPCCLGDVAAMQALVEATGRYEVVRGITDLDGDAMREAIRQALPPDGCHDEVLFYFSGHGAQIEGEFYYCGIGFDASRPNETGMSHSELHNLLRAAETKLLVKIIDACFSGTLLVKGDRQPLPMQKEGFRYVLQFSSSLDDQTSFGGEPLSAFTRAFLEASVRKTEGAIYYTDVANTLRDDFLGNNEQTPFFVSQGTGREVLVDDAVKLAAFRETLKTHWSAQEVQGDADEEEGATGATIVAEPMSLKELLVAAEERMGGPQDAKKLIDTLFDGVLTRFQIGEFGELFECTTTEHSSFYEPTVHDFMVRVLVREPRHDRLVTAEIKREQKRPTSWGAWAAPLMMLNPEWTEHYNLELNCALERAQLRFTLTPRYRALQQLVLVLSCAPSLERCYVFEMVTQNPRTDWDNFGTEGREVVRRWYKLHWDEALDGLIEKICDALENAVRENVQETTARLTK